MTSAGVQPGAKVFRGQTNAVRMPVVEARHMNVSRSNALVVEDASFTIYQGDYVGIVGPNGGGKTTLLMALLGVLPRDSGEVRLFGEPLERFRDWHLVAYVSQDAVSFDADFPLSVRELVALGMANRGNLTKRLTGADWKVVDDMLGEVGMADLADDRIGHLSGGQKQRMFVAKALVRDPKILFLDEPVAGVDAVTQEKFYKMLNDLNIARGITICTVSHDLAAVFCRMSKVMCVNRLVNVSEVRDIDEPGEFLKKAYGEHFHFVFHRHECGGVFGSDRPVAP